jgi:hypothetical protein
MWNAKQVKVNTVLGTELETIWDRGKWNAFIISDSGISSAYAYLYRVFRGQADWT